MKKISEVCIKKIDLPACVMTYVLVSGFDPGRKAVDESELM